jgi:hypothetical protein
LCGFSLIFFRPSKNWQKPWVYSKLIPLIGLKKFQEVTLVTVQMRALVHTNNEVIYACRNL